MCVGIFTFLKIDRAKTKSLWVLGKVGRVWVNDLVNFTKKHAVLIINNLNLIGRRFKMRPWENKFDANDYGSD